MSMQIVLSCCKAQRSDKDISTTELLESGLSYLHLQGFPAVLELIKSRDFNEGFLNSALLEIRDEVGKTLADHF